MTVRPSLELLCEGEAATRAAGRDLARWLAAGDLVLLSGDLGSGKTVFVRGLAEGLGADGSEVASPTFALVHEYGPPGRPPVLAHADLFRLSREEGRSTLSELGIPELLQKGTIVAIEWPLPPFTSWSGWRVSLSVEPPGRRAVRVSFRP